MNAAEEKLLDDLKQKNAELENLVKVRTSQLSEKNQELNIENALEKVRSVALELTKSEDMLHIAQVLYEQLLVLGFSDIRNAIIDIHNDDNETFLDYDYSHDMCSAITPFSFYGDPVIEEQIKKIKSSNDAFFEIELKGDQLKELIKTRLRNGEKDDPRLYETDHLTYNLYSFGNGAIGISNFGILSDEQKIVLKRFRNVFSFAYKRYSELKYAESQIREAQIEAALEKVRSKSMAMQKSSEFAETSMVVFDQMLHLGIKPTRLFIGIFKENNSDVEAWATNEDGTKIGNKFTLSTKENTTVQKMYNSWNLKKSSVTLEMQGQELQNYFEYLSDKINISFKDGLSQERRVQTLAFFSQGVIGMASVENQPEESTQLLERFAAVFNITFTRFNDLKIAEAQSLKTEKDLIKIKNARQEAENSLLELQSTQKQLIQSEKMASLGELTAGIAHEIQNPLNFVNNFSEISTELLQEMKDEIEKENFEEVKELAIDIIQNLEKITHHGKRADGIVKGMLQHSRSSSGVKEPTDLNAICDEYLRLSYHGLRAKDKTFNATLNSNFDESIGKINLVPQDFGRVILNLITNAFYAVNEKKLLNIENYKPTVSISTKKENNSIIITVTDNGNGISEENKSKIFQPFFTTKPTGKGTGLGLSMSYDIITKGHSGILKVESKKNEETSFIIQLPQNNEIKIE